MLNQQDGTWTVSQAKTNLSTILRRAKAGTPQIIGAREQYVVVPLDVFQKQQRPPIGTWLIQEGAKVALEDEDVILPSRHDDRPVPFEGMAG